MLHKGSPRRALLEANLTVLIWLLLVFAWGGGERYPDFLRSGISFANSLGAVILVVRAYPLTRWREIGLLLVHGMIMSANVAVVCALFSISSALFSQFLAIIIVGTLVLTTGGRLLRRFWYGWNKLRRSNIVWSLTHAHLMLVEGMILALLLTLIVLQVALFQRPLEPNNAPTPLLEQLVTLDAYVTIGGGLTFIILAVVLPPSALFSYVVSRRLVHRILMLEQATAQVEQGDYSVQVPVEGEDEIARLQARYNAMTATLHQTIQKLQVEQATVAGLSKLQRDMVANVSHDLRTPLATLQIYLETLSPAPETTLIKEEIDHLRRLTDDLFNAAQNETLALTLRLSPLQIKPLLENIVAVTHATARENRQIEIFIDVPPDLPPLLLDGDRFSQIIRNLLQNALRWTPPGGMILVKAVQKNGAVQIDIQDTGIGIASDELSKIWRRSYRLDPTVEGSGLGLSMVKNLVEAMQGSISVTSVVNSGSCFSMEFPV